MNEKIVSFAWLLVLTSRLCALVLVPPVMPVAYNKLGTPVTDRNVYVGSYIAYTDQHGATTGCRSNPIGAIQIVHKVSTR